MSIGGGLNDESCPMPGGSQHLRREVDRRGSIALMDRAEPTGRGMIVHPPAAMSPSLACRGILFVTRQTSKTRCHLVVVITMSVTSRSLRLESGVSKVSEPSTDGPQITSNTSCLMLAINGKTGQCVG